MFLTEKKKKDYHMISVITSWATIVKKQKPVVHSWNF